MKKNIQQFGIIAGVFGIPLLTLAADKDLYDIMKLVTGYFQNFIKLIISLAIVTFVWNVYKYYFKADADRTEAGKYVLYSVIGFFVILSLWGLVNIVDRTFSLNNRQPDFPFGGGLGGSNSTPFSGSGLTQPSAPGSSGLTQPSGFSNPDPSSSQGTDVPYNSDNDLPPENNGIGNPWDH